MKSARSGMPKPTLIKNADLQKLKKVTLKNYNFFSNKVRRMIQFCLELTFYITLLSPNSFFFESFFILFYYLFYADFSFAGLDDRYRSGYHYQFIPL